MSPLWGSVKRDGDFLWKVVDRDACERAIIEYFPDACENVSVKLDVKKYLMIMVSRLCFIMQLAIS